MIDTYMHITWNDGFQFLKAAGVTLFVTFISIFLGTILGIVFGLIRCSKNKVISWLPLIIMEPLRNSPLVTQLFLVFYGLPMVSNIVLDAYPAAILTLSLNTAAFFGVLVHNSVATVPRMQTEAGLALGHSYFSVFVNIIFRQALRLLLPQAIMLYIGQLQTSSLVALISLQDIARTGQMITERTLMPFTVWGLVFLIYFAISYPLSRYAQVIEKRINFTY